MFYVAVPVNVYRLGNAGSPKLTNVRIGKDVIVDDGIVIANGMGMSLSSSTSGWKGHIWLLSEGIELPEGLMLINDHGNHYSLAPTEDMPLDVYKELLERVQVQMIHYGKQ